MAKQGFPNVEPIRPGYDWRTRIVLPQAYWDGEAVADDRLVAHVRASRPGPLLAVADTGNATIEREDPRTLVVTLGAADTLKLAGSAIAVFDFVSVDEDGGQRPLDGMWTWPVLPTVTRDIDGTLPAPDPLFSGRTGSVVATFDWTAPQAAVDWAPVVIPGPHGQGLYVVDSAADLTEGFGRDGDRAIIRQTGREWLKTGGVWVDTGDEFLGSLLPDTIAAKDAAEEAAASAAESAASALGVRWRDDVNGGEWQAGTQYVVRDAVFHDPSSFRAIVAHTASPENEPNYGSSWASFWRLLARGGVISPFNRQLDFTQQQNSALLALLEDI